MPQVRFRYHGKLESRRELDTPQRAALPAGHVSAKELPETIRFPQTVRRAPLPTNVHAVAPAACVPQANMQTLFGTAKAVLGSPSDGCGGSWASGQGSAVRGQERLGWKWLLVGRRLGEGNLSPSHPGDLPALSACPTRLPAVVMWVLGSRMRQFGGQWWGTARMGGGGGRFSGGRVECGTAGWRTPCWVGDGCLQL